MKCVSSEEGGFRMSLTVSEEEPRCPVCGGRLQAVQTGVFMGKPEWALRCVECGWEGES